MTSLHGTGMREGKRVGCDRALHFCRGCSTYLVTYMFDKEHIWPIERKDLAEWPRIAHELRYAHAKDHAR